MCPVYEFSCPKCSRPQGRKVLDVVRPMSQAGDPYRCPDCGAETERVYSFNRPKEFAAYTDEEYGCVISSERQEKAEMRKRGHVPFRETPAYQNPRWREARKLARKKPMYFTSAGASKMDRD